MQNVQRDDDMNFGSLKRVCYFSRTSRAFCRPSYGAGKDKRARPALEHLDTQYRRSEVGCEYMTTKYESLNRSGDP